MLMSGGGGGGWFPPNKTNDCNFLTINTNLASPDPTVLATVSVGDFLEIYLVSPRGPAQALTAAGEIAGALLPVDLATLLDCINDGHDYQAKVVSLSGGNCQVLINHI